MNIRIVNPSRKFWLRSAIVLVLGLLAVWLTESFCLSSLNGEDSYTKLVDQQVSTQRRLAVERNTPLTNEELGIPGSVPAKSMPYRYAPQAEPPSMVNLDHRAITMPDGRVVQIAIAICYDPKTGRNRPYVGAVEPQVDTKFIGDPDLVARAQNGQWAIVDIARKVVKGQRVEYVELQGAPRITYQKNGEQYFQTQIWAYVL